MNFNDHFSSQSDDYRLFRPHYPVSLYEWLCSIVPANSTAWDCATGTGQAAQQLAEYFDEVIATDGSEQQISQAKPQKNIRYEVARESCDLLEPSSVDLITVAQALHWFDTDKFFNEAQRVLKTNGVLAVWTYNLLSIDREVDAIINDLYWDGLDGYWPSERRLVEEAYQSIQFPFDEIPAPDFKMSHFWQRDHLLGYLGTWSAVKKFRRERQEDPLFPISNALKDVWPDDDQLRQVHWQLTLRVTVKPDHG